MITYERLHELLDYDPANGIFKWNIAPAKHIIAGQPAGTLNKFGYWQVRINKKSYLAHRLAWLWMTGEWPICQIDHINRHKSDNRFINLREATIAQNRANSRANKTGFKRVRKNHNCSTWRADIGVDGKEIHLGNFPTEAEARNAYAVAAIKYFKEFARF